MGFKKFFKGRKRGLGGLRSNFEKNFALLLHKIGVEFKYEDAEIPYVLENKYTPDFRIGRSLFIETKGLFTQEDRRKHIAIREQHPEIEIRFVFQRDNKLYKKSDTRYSDWCIRNGFKYHVGEGIPEDWVREFKESIEQEIPLDSAKGVPVQNKKSKKIHRKLWSF